MCFSATASFTVSAALAVVGVLSVSIAPRRLRLFAGTPLIFSIQQALEGLVWLFSSSRPVVAQIATYGFIFIALVWWPLWSSVVFLYRGEKSRIRNLGLWSTLFVGGLLSVVSIWLLIDSGVVAQVTTHIAYDLIRSPSLTNVFLYVLATLAPLVITSERYIWILAILVGCAYIATSRWFPIHIASVWCFFAAVVSSGILGFVFVKRQSYTKRNK